MIGEIIDSGLIAARGEPWVKKKFYASDLGKCRRALYYELTGVERKPLSAKAIRRMELGKAAQEIEAKILRNCEMLDGTTASEEVRIDGGFIGARCDWIVKDGAGNKIIVEVKTLGEFQTRGLMNALDKLQWTKENHQDYLWQLLFYLDNRDDHLPGIIRYIGLNGQAMDVPEHGLELDSPEIQDDLNAMREECKVYQYFKTSGPAPPRQGTCGKGRCSYCDFAELCWLDAKPEEIEVTETDEELVLEYLSAKEEEKRIADKLAELKPKVEARLKERDNPIITSIGGMKLQVSNSISYTKNLDALRDILGPAGLFNEILEPSDKKVKDLVKLGFITADALEAAKTVTTTTSIRQIKPGE